MNLVLIGYRGTGKSTLGKRLAEVLSLKYVSLDEEIIRHAGMSIPDIVEKHSWDHFRELEEATVEDVTQRDGQVLDTGGGVITRPKSIERLRQTGVVFLLEAEIDDILERIGGDTQRPSLTGNKSFLEEVREVLEERNPLYRKTAHHVIDTSALAPEAAVEKIATTFREATGR